MLNDTENDLFQIVDVLPENNVSEILTHIRDFLDKNYLIRIIHLI